MPDSGEDFVLVKAGRPGQVPVIVTGNEKLDSENFRSASTESCVIVLDVHKQSPYLLRTKPRVNDSTPPRPRAERQLIISSRDDGYSCLARDFKTADTRSTSSSPSTWPTRKGKSHVSDWNKFVEQMTSNEQVVDPSNPSQSVFCDSSLSPDSSSKKPLLIERTTSCTCPEPQGKVRSRCEHILELGTCFICLRSAVYQFAEEDETDSLAEHPCQCDTPSQTCCGRWALISVMVCMLPLLLFYPPIKACLALHDLRIRRKKRRKNRR